MRYLIGPVTSEYAAGPLRLVRRSGACLTFGASGADVAVGPADSWDELCGRLPLPWRPDFVMLRLDAAGIPPWLWSAPVPLVGLASGWELRWHHYLHAVPRCDLVVSDPRGAEALRRAGHDHVLAGNLHGCDPALLERPCPDGPRDIDILFAGDLHAAAQRLRLPWVARLANFADRYHVVLRPHVGDEEYRALLARSRIVFVYSARDGDPCPLAPAAAGCLLFQEHGNGDVSGFFGDRRECVYYGVDDLEELLEHYLTHEEERSVLAAAARARVAPLSFDHFWEEVLRGIETAWPLMQERACRRPAPSGLEALLARTWQAVTDGVADPALARDLEEAGTALPTAALHNLRGVVDVPARAVEHFRRALACDRGHVLAQLNLAEALAITGRAAEAAEQARRALEMLDGQQSLAAEVLRAPHFPLRLDFFRVEWERAGWENAGDPAGEERAKRRLLAWRLHGVAAKEGGDLYHRYEAALARPDLPATRATLGWALLQQKRFTEAASHLRLAVAGNPFDRLAPRALADALGALGRTEELGQLVRQRRRLSRAAPALVEAEPWFAEKTTPTRRFSVSLMVIARNEEHNLADCVRPVLDLVDEVIVVDTGSTDHTREVAASLGPKVKVFDFPWCDSFAAARNEAIQHAGGDWLFWLDADDRLDEANRERLRGLFASLGDENAAYLMRSWSAPDAVSGSVVVVDHARLFRNRPEVRWEYRVHEQILPSALRTGAAARPTGVVIRHLGYQDPALRRRKLERNLRLLELEWAERPDDPLVLFNLAGLHLDFGRPAEAVPLLRRSLERSLPGYSLTPKTHALLACALRQLGGAAEALAACREGRRHFPKDVELLFHEGSLLREVGDRAGAEASLRQLLALPPPPAFNCADAGVSGYKARHLLGVVCREQGRPAEAETEWRASVAERADFVPAWLALAELYLEQGRLAELERVLTQLEASPQTQATAAVVRGRVCLERKEFTEARRLLEAVIAHSPHALWPRVMLGHVLMAEGKDTTATIEALRAVLALDPNQTHARQQLLQLLASQPVLVSA